MGINRWRSVKSSLFLYLNFFPLVFRSHSFALEAPAGVDDVVKFNFVRNFVVMAGLKWTDAFLLCDVDYVCGMTRKITILDRAFIQGKMRVNTTTTFDLTSHARTTKKIFRLKVFRRMEIFRITAV